MSEVKRIQLVFHLKNGDLVATTQNNLTGKPGEYITTQTVSILTGSPLNTVKSKLTERDYAIHDEQGTEWVSVHHGMDLVSLP